MHAVKIHMQGHGRGTVEVDGHKLTAKSISVDAGVDQPTTVTMTILVDSVEWSQPVEAVGSDAGMMRVVKS
jgi:hypothetical protein